MQYNKRVSKKLWLNRLFFTLSLTFVSLQVFRDDNGSLQVRGAVIASEVWRDKWALTSLFSGFRSAQVNAGEWRDASLLFVVAIETARSAPGWQASRLGWMGDVTALAPGSLLGFVWTIWEKNQSTAMQSYASEYSRAQGDALIWRNLEVCARKSIQRKTMSRTFVLGK